MLEGLREDASSSNDSTPADVASVGSLSWADFYHFTLLASGFYLLYVRSLVLIGTGWCSDNGKLLRQ